METVESLKDLIKTILSCYEHLDAKIVELPDEQGYGQFPGEDARIICSQCVTKLKNALAN